MGPAGRRRNTCAGPGGWAPGKEQPASVRLSRALSWRLAPLTCDRGSRPGDGAWCPSAPRPYQARVEQLPRRVLGWAGPGGWEPPVGLPSRSSGSSEGSSVPRSAAGDPVNGVEHLSVASLPRVRGISECLPAQEGPRHAGPSTVRSRLVWVSGVTVES